MNILNYQQKLMPPVSRRRGFDLCAVFVVPHRYKSLIPVRPLENSKRVSAAWHSTSEALS